MAAVETVCKYGARALVTGAGRGIGLELVRQLQDAGCEVIATVRKPSEALTKMGVRVITGIDVGSDAVVTALPEKLGDVKLDLVINNAGVLSVENFDNMDWDAMRFQFEVNTLGPMRIVKALDGHLKEGSKIANVTSRMGSIADSSGGMYGYRMSKAALNIAMKAMSQDLAPRKIAVALLHPGFVATDMTSKYESADKISAETSAAGMLQRIVELSLENTGTFWHQNGEVLPW